jgi:hypothetical protein
LIDFRTRLAQMNLPSMCLLIEDVNRITADHDYHYLTTLATIAVAAAYRRSAAESLISR